ncbi:unnamed protein product [Effrenium voratum]|nr:unnamed protein product [Effrenium voratum]
MWELVGPPQDLVDAMAIPGQVASMTWMISNTLRHAPLVVLLMLQLCAAGAESEQEESCSKVLGFNESSGPKDRSSQDLSFCDEHHKRTCCEKNHTKQVRTAFAAFSHERSGRCAQLGRLAFCSLCDGDVGIGMKANACMRSSEAFQV